MRRQQRRVQSAAVGLPRFASDAPRATLVVTTLALAIATAAATAPFIIMTIRPALMIGLALAAASIVGPAATMRRVSLLLWWPLAGGIAAAAGGVALLAVVPSAHQEVYGLVAALSFATAQGVALFFAPPVVAAVMVRRRPSHDGIDVVLLVCAAWIAVVAVTSVAVSWLARSDVLRLPLGAGGWTTFAQWAALVVGSVLAGWLLVRDSARARWWGRLTAAEGALRLSSDVAEPDEAPPPPLLRLLPGGGRLVVADDPAAPALASVTHESQPVQALLLRRRAWALALLVLQLGGAAMLVADWSFHRAPLRDVVQLAAGWGHVCARRGDGSVWCWGDVPVSSDGTLVDSQLRARRVAGIDDAIELVSGDDEVCVLRRDRSVWCWYRGEDAVLGLRKVEGLDEASHLVAGDVRTCALDGEGWVWCWGRGGAIDATPVELRAARVTELGRALLLAVDHEGVCALGDEGLRCSWEACQASPIGLPPSDRSLVQLALSRGELCALRDDGTLLCGALRRDCAIVELTPRAARGRVEQLVGGSFEICTMDHNGLVACRDESGALTHFERPDGRALSVGSSHYCVLVEGGQVACWGGNRHGQLGDGTRRNRDDPETVRY